MGTASELSQLDKSCSTPAEQVGKQIERGFGWRTSAGRAGLCAGCTDDGAEGIELLAHPALSIPSPSFVQPLLLAASSMGLELQQQTLAERLASP
nr:hypothetical protein [Variovorax sp. PAMC26660]